MQSFLSALLISLTDIIKDMFPGLLAEDGAGLPSPRTPYPTINPAPKRMKAINMNIKTHITVDSTGLKSNFKAITYLPFFIFVFWISRANKPKSPLDGRFF